MSRMNRITFCFLVIIIARLASGQVLPRRVLYGLPPLPEDEEEILSRVRTTTTLKPLVQRVFPHLFTLPPINLPPVVPYTVNPVPELPPMPESRIDGHFNEDGDFVPNKKPEEDKQVNENRIHGVKIESLAASHFLSHSPTPKVAFNDDPPRAYSKVRGIGLVTVAPSQLPKGYRHFVSSQESNPEEERETAPRTQPESRGPKNARQWQTTATKISSNQMRIQGLFDGTIENIDRVSEDPTSQVRENNLPKAKRIRTTNLPIGAFGSHERPDFTSPTPPSVEIHQTRRVPTLGISVTPSRRIIASNTKQRFFDDDNIRIHRVQLERTKNFNYTPKQRTFQPEIFEPVTVVPQVRSRQLPNPPKPRQIFRNPKPATSNPPPRSPSLLPPPAPRRPPRPPTPTLAPRPPPPPSHPPSPPPQFIQIQTTLPPQPYNRAPEDAAFLAEIEDYDWKLYYKQHALENYPPKANPLGGFNRVHGSPQSGPTPVNNDYEDIEAIKNRERFTDNPPQRSFTLPSGIVTTTPASEVLVPFSNTGDRLTSENINVGGQVPTAHSIGTGVNGFPANIGGNFQAPTIYQAVTPHPVFGGLFNLFNFNGQNNGGFLLPGFGR